MEIRFPKYGDLIYYKFKYLYRTSFSFRTKMEELGFPGFRKTERRSRKELFLLFRQMIENGEPRPSHRTNKSLARALGNALSNRSKYKCKAIQKLVYTSPSWFLNSYRLRAYLKFLAAIPDGVQYKTSQKWRGGKQRHHFHCAKFGNFSAKPDELMSQPWKVGRSGHPKMTNLARSEAASLRLSGKRKVKNLSTGETFRSVSEAERLNQCSGSITRAIKNKHKAAGCHWEYV